MNGRHRIQVTYAESVSTGKENILLRLIVLILLTCGAALGIMTHHPLANWGCLQHPLTAGCSVPPVIG